MAEFLTIFFSIGAGIVLAGLLTSIVELFMPERAGFGLLFSGKSAAVTLAITLFIMVSGPLLLARTITDFYRDRHAAGVSVAAIGAGSWGFVTGLLSLNIYFHII